MPCAKTYLRFVVSQPITSPNCSANLRKSLSHRRLAWIANARKRDFLSFYPVLKRTK